MRRSRSTCALLAAALALVGCGGGETNEAAAEQEQPKAEPVRPSADQLPPGTTPVAERVAVLGLLNKRNGLSRDLRLKPGEAVRVDDVIVRVQTCETTPAWEPEPLTGAFVQVDVRNLQDQFQRVFSGWLWRESPSLNAVEHPIYDVWTKSCEMTHPDGTAASGDTPAADSSNSSAPKSGPARSAPPAGQPKASSRPATKAAAASNSAANNSR
jgi:hypothetical protein